MHERFSMFLIGKSLIVVGIIFCVVFSFSVVYSQDSILTFHLVHPQNETLSHLPQSDVKVDKSQYEWFTKGGENYWINRKVELDINDIMGAKIEMEIWPAYSQKAKTIEIPPEGFRGINLETYGNAFKVEIVFNQWGRKRLELLQRLMQESVISITL